MHLRIFLLPIGKVSIKLAGYFSLDPCSRGRSQVLPVSLIVLKSAKDLPTLLSFACYSLAL